MAGQGGRACLGNPLFESLWNAPPDRTYARIAERLRTNLSESPVSPGLSDLFGSAKSSSARSGQNKIGLFYGFFARPNRNGRGNIDFKYSTRPGNTSEPGCPSTTKTIRIKSWGIVVCINFGANNGYGWLDFRGGTTDVASHSGRLAEKAPTCLQPQA